MTEQEIATMKYKWQFKQIKRISNSAYLYGPRESVKHIWINSQYNNDLPPKNTLVQRIKKIFHKVIFNK
jgi:hypothetical protein